MKLSAKSRYGLKAMYYLGKNNSDDEKPICLKTIAKFTDISVPYLEKLLGVLRKQGLIVSTRGAGGGYRLAKKPKDISVGDVIRALEGEVLYVECVAQKCNKINCPNKNVFEDLYIQINEVLDRTTLQKMIENN